MVMNITTLPVVYHCNKFSFFSFFLLRYLVVHRMLVLWLASCDTSSPAERQQHQTSYEERPWRLHHPRYVGCTNSTVNDLNSHLLTWRAGGGIMTFRLSVAVPPIFGGSLVWRLRRLTAWCSVMGWGKRQRVLQGFYQARPHMVYRLVATEPSS